MNVKQQETSIPQMDDEDFSGAEIKPYVRHNTELLEASTQTGQKVVSVSKASQVLGLSKSAYSQTNDSVTSHKRVPKLMDPANVNFGTLLDFLNRVLPMIEDELEQSTSIQMALDRLAENDYRDNVQQNTTLTIELVHTLTSVTATGTDFRLDATSISWNCNGTVLAGGYGKVEDLG